MWYLRERYPVGAATQSIARPVGARAFLLADFAYKARDVSPEELRGLAYSQFVSSDVQEVITTIATQRLVDGMARKVLILVAKPNELVAARAALDLQSVQPLVIHGYRVWHSTIGSGEEVTPVLLSMIGDQGPNLAANACHALIPHFGVNVAILCGTAAGVRGKTALGDVITAQVVKDIAGSRLELAGELPRYRDYGIPDLRWRELAYFLALEDKWWIDLGEATTRLPSTKVPKQVTASWKPDLHDAMMLSKPVLRADGGLPSMRQSIDERVRGAEMEASGFCSACEALQAQWWVFKGVSDFGDPNTKDKKPRGETNRKVWQFPATVASIVFALNFVRHLIQGR
jgi:nucleoside phosphorylase